MKRMVMVMLGVLAVCANIRAASVTNVRGMQRGGGNFVDIYYDLDAAEGETFEVEVGIEGQNESVKVSRVKGAVGKGISPGVNLHVEWDAGADWAGKNGQLKAVVTATKEETSSGQVKKVQLWAGGPYWATTNIGAENPEDYGYYFWWGDTVGYKRENNKWVASDGSNSNFSFTGSNMPTYDKSMSTLRNEGWLTSDGVLAPDHDAATVHWGNGWRMPTMDEIIALNNNCDWTWTTLNGVKGCVVKGRGAYASNSIFLPAAGNGLGTSLYYSGSEGCYWSSVPDSDSYTTCYLYFISGLHFTYYHLREFGQSVRPVSGFTK